ncbi:MAG: hypothetical protein JW837_09290 [Sedimentisphaerales bacterium]|nr:hypothetical protein [Sedimentisphaerales bacterium]
MKSGVPHTTYDIRHTTDDIQNTICANLCQSVAEKTRRAGMKKGRDWPALIQQMIIVSNQKQ